MATNGGSDSNRPAIDTPLSLEAITSAAPTQASDVISRSGTEADPSRITPNSSSSPAPPQIFFQNAVSGTGMNLTASIAPSASSQARKGVR